MAKRDAVFLETLPLKNLFSVGATEQLVVTHVEGSDQLYIANANELNAVWKRLDELYLGSTDPLRCVEKLACVLGSTYAGFVQGLWSRVMLLKIYPEYYQVFCVDYGCVCLIEKKFGFKKLDASLAKIPGQAINSYLHDFPPLSGEKLIDLQRLLFSNRKETLMKIITVEETRLGISVSIRTQNIIDILKIPRTVRTASSSPASKINHNEKESEKILQKIKGETSRKTEKTSLSTTLPVSTQQSDTQSSLISNHNFSNSFGHPGNNSAPLIFSPPPPYTSFDSSGLSYYLPYNVLYNNNFSPQSFNCALQLASNSNPWSSLYQQHANTPFAHHQLQRPMFPYYDSCMKAAYEWNAMILASHPPWPVAQTSYPPSHLQFSSNYLTNYFQTNNAQVANSASPKLAICDFHRPLPSQLSRNSQNTSRSPLIRRSGFPNSNDLESRQTSPSNSPQIPASTPVFCKGLGKDVLVDMPREVEDDRNKYNKSEDVTVEKFIMESDNDEIELPILPSIDEIDGNERNSNQ